MQECLQNTTLHGLGPQAQSRVQARTGPGPGPVPIGTKMEQEGRRQRLGSKLLCLEGISCSHAIRRESRTSKIEDCQTLGERAVAHAYGGTKTSVAAYVAAILMSRTQLVYKRCRNL